MAEDRIRIDKWLWHARFFKTRTLAAKIVSEGKVRVDGTHVKKPSATIGPGDTLTFAKEQDIRLIRVVGIGTRRGPASEAQALYEDLAPPELQPKTPAQAQHPDAARGRPTKQERRRIDALRKGPLEPPTDV